MAAKTRRQQLEAMIADDPDDALSRYFLAMDYLGAGENDEARQRFEEMFALTPEYVPAYVQAGQLLVRMGRPAEAAVVFRHGIETARKQNDEHAAGEMEAFLQQID
jgi:cytochrome c-type biogenesis protein CcmH/NrfG